MRYKLVIEYDGSPFVGWQKQENGLSVQEVIENAILSLSQEQVTVFGAGRTDTGVHAMGQVGHFDISKKELDTQTVFNGLNHHLRPYPISILAVDIVSEEFHSRFDAKKRTYKYIIINRKNFLVLDKNRAWLVKKKLNIHSMKKAIKLFLGTHNFNAFRSSSCGAKSPVRTIENSSITKKGNKIMIIFSSKSFLQQQVRSMVGCLKFIGEGKWTLDNLKRLLKSKNRSHCAPPAPPNGLYLYKVNY